MNIKELKGEWCKVFFSEKDRKKISKKSGVYLITTFSGDVLYIGISVDLQRRFCEHVRSSKAFVLTPKGKSFWFYYSFCHEKEHRSLERGLLLQVELTEGHLPWFNQVRAPT